LSSPTGEAVAIALIENVEEVLMGRVRAGLRRLTKSPGVPKARHIAERSLAPYLRSDLHLLGVDHGSTVNRLASLELKVETMSNRLTETDAAVSAIESHQPTILNAMASVNGTTRLLARRTDELTNDVIQISDGLKTLMADLAHQKHTTDGWLGSVGDTLKKMSESETVTRDRLESAWTAFQNGDDSVRNDFRPHIDTISWLLQRIETVRAEMMHELRYGSKTATASIEPRVVNPGALKADELRLNLGAGHIALDGFVNVDMRELPGIDVVAPVNSLPFAQGTLAEIFSSHTIEHFPELELRRQLLPYWLGLLRPGGVFRAVAPDLEAMSKAFANGDISFEVFRSVAYGGQEYEGDFHFNGFSPASVCALLAEAGFDSPTVIASGRQNGDCLEFEVSALKPTT